MDAVALLQEVECALAGKDGRRAALGLVIRHLGMQSGTLHLLGDDGMLHLEAVSDGMPEQVLAVIRRIPVGKGMAGLAVERGEPVTSCNIQTDDSGDVRPGARATGMEGAIVVPVMRDDEVVGALGVAVREPREFSPEETDLLLRVGRAIAGA